MPKHEKGIMNIRIFLFNEQPGNSADRTVRALRAAFAGYLPDEKAVTLYPAIKDASGQITEAFKDSHVVIFLTAPAQYAETKKKISRSFNIKMEINEELQSKAFISLNKIINNASAEEYAHCVTPVNARVFSLEDGLYSGFSVASGNQTIIFLPFENGRTDILLSRQVIPYINSAYHTEISLDAFRRFNCERLASAMSLHGNTIALAKTNTSSYFLDYVAENKTIVSSLTDSQLTEKRGDMAPEEYIVNLSIMAKEIAGSDYGIAFSNAYYTGSDENAEKLIYLAVTGDKKTSVRETRSLKGESVEDFLERTSGDLCTFIADVIDTDADTSSAVNKTVKARVKNYKIGIAITSFLIAAVVTAIVLVFSSNNYTMKKWFTDMKNFIFPGQNEFETTVIYSDDDLSDDTDESDESDEETTLFIAG